MDGQKIEPDIIWADLNNREWNIGDEVYYDEQTGLIPTEKIGRYIGNIIRRINNTNYEIKIKPNIPEYEMDSPRGKIEKLIHEIGWEEVLEQIKDMADDYYKRTDHVAFLLLRQNLNHTIINFNPPDHFKSP